MPEGKSGGPGTVFCTGLEPATPRRAYLGLRREDRMPIIEQWSGGAIDVAVVGAGAAGLAAAKRLMTLPDLSILVIEAGSRIGGRARTFIAQPGNLPLDLGCAWLHSARTNAWTSIAPTLGFTVDRTPAPWNRGEVDADVSPDDSDDMERIEAEFERRIADFVTTGRDGALGELLAPDHPWRGRLDAVSTYVSGAELDRVSAVDHERYRPGEGADLRVLEGYGSLIAAFGAIVPVVLDAPVTRLDHSGGATVGIDTRRGRIEARAAIVTVSTDVLASGAITFTPALPDKRDAAADLPLGLANKLFLRLGAGEDLPVESYRLGSPHRAATGAYHIRPFGHPIIECFYGGRLARDLEDGGIGAFSAFAGEELARLFGSGIASRVTPVVATAWAREPHILGSYAYAVPGKADSRAILAAPVENRLFFAGEATSPERFTTAHGAYESGVAAADAVLRSLGRGPTSTIA